MADTCLLAGVHSVCMVVNKLELSGCGPICSLEHNQSVGHQTVILSFCPYMLVLVLPQFITLMSMHAYAQ